MTGFSSENETLLLILDIYFAQAFVTVHCHLIRCSGKYHNLCEAGEIKKPTMELPGVNKKQAPLLAKETVGSCPPSTSTFSKKIHATIGYEDNH